MKTSKLLTITLLFVISIFAFSPAKASTLATATPPSSGLWSSLGDLLGDLFGGGSSNGSGSTSGTGGSSSTGGTGGGASLPINNNIWFLVIAGAAVGCKVIINKSKAPAVQPVKI